MPKRVTRLQTRVARLLRLREVCIATSYYDRDLPAHLRLGSHELYKKQLRWVEYTLQLTMVRAIVCGKVTRAVRHAWASGVVLRTAGRI